MYTFETLMPTLHWIGKEKVINHHLDVPYRVLDYSFGVEKGEYRSTEIRSGNKIIHGDNLEALKSLLPEHEGKIKCVYIDPPYNTGNESWIYNDNVNDPKLQRWLGQVVGSESEDLSRHDKWLCMMYPRLKLLHRLLQTDGVIFISLDENEIHHIRCLMNEIFGAANFVAQITLLCNPKGRSQDKHFSTNHEYIVVYGKSNLPKDFFSVDKDEDSLDRDYKLSDDGGRYRLLELRNTHREFSRINRPNLFYPFYVNEKTAQISLLPDERHNREVLPLWPDGFEGCWTWGRDLAAASKDLLIAKENKSGWKVYRKSYATETDGTAVKKKLFTIWNDPAFYTEKGQITFGEIFPGFNKNDFPQPKSVELISRILETCTTGNDLVLDSFAGSGTTAQAVLQLNKKDSGSRKFICIEREDYAKTITAERIKRVISGYGTEGGMNGTFDYYELGGVLFTEENELNELVGPEKLRRYIYYTETGKHLPPTSKSENNYLLEHCNGISYYFFYEQDQVTTLSYEFLSTIKTKAEGYVIYADKCLLTKEFMNKNKIVFKKIARDITKF